MTLGASYASCKALTGHIYASICLCVCKPWVFKTHHFVFPFSLLSPFPFSLFFPVFPHYHVRLHALKTSAINIGAYNITSSVDTSQFSGGQSIPGGGHQHPASSPAEYKKKKKKNISHLSSAQVFKIKPCDRSYRPRGSHQEHSSSIDSQGKRQGCGCQSRRRSQ